MNASATKTAQKIRRRLVGGLLRPIDPDDLKIAVRESLASVQLGESRADQEFARHGARRGLAVITHPVEDQAHALREGHY